MKVLLLVTKDCQHRHTIKEYLHRMGVSFEVQYVDDHAELVAKYNINSALNLIIDHKQKIEIQTLSDNCLPSYYELKQSMQKYLPQPAGRRQALLLKQQHGEPPAGFANIQKFD
ncbi:MAG: hypothetical protein GWP06_18750 [Actinobacteria bacterium]|nr:hypothetical protein [Actinomycetota bacterium]